MADPLPTPTPGEVTAAREAFKGKLADCPHCGGWSKPDPRRAPVRYEVAICDGAGHRTWAVQCFGCWSTASGWTAAEAVENWNRRVPGVQAHQQLLPLVDLQAVARFTGLELTPALEMFARHVQADVLSLNRRPLQ